MNKNILEAYFSIFHLKNEEVTTQNKDEKAALTLMQRNDHKDFKKLTLKMY